MFAIGTRSRAALMCASVGCFAFGFAFTPLTARSMAASKGNAGAPISDPRQREPIAAITPVRDPFAAPGDSVTPSPSPSAVVQPLPALPGELAPLPPNRGAAAFGTQPRLAAVITGPHAAALFDDGNSVRLIGVGDRIVNRRVVRIDEHGVHLANGTTLAVSRDGR